jgi:hypothetical protein
MIIDRQPAAVAERRRDEPTINAITPASTATPRRIHSQSRFVPDPPVVVSELVGCAAADD